MIAAHDLLAARPQIVTSLPASASTIEKAVPHDPAPKTAILRHGFLPDRGLRGFSLGFPIGLTPALRGSNRSAGGGLAAQVGDERR